MVTAALAATDSPDAAATSRGMSETARALQSGVFDLRSKLLPDSLTLIGDFDFESESDRRFFGQIQGRTYVNLFAALERLVDDATEAEVAGGWADPRQVLFRRMDKALGHGMPAGYRAVANLERVGRNNGSWGVGALALSVEFFKQAHFDACAQSDESLSPMFQNAFLRKQAGVSLQAMIAEIEWILRHTELSYDARELAVDNFIELIEKLDRTVQAQAALDARYFKLYAVSPMDKETVAAAFRKAYRWQFLLAGMAHPRFAEVLKSLVMEGQGARIKRALETVQ